MMHAKEAKEISRRNRKVALEVEVDKLLREAADKGLRGIKVDVDYMDDSYPTILQNLTFLGYTVSYYDADFKMCNVWTVSW